MRYPTDAEVMRYPLNHRETDPKVRRAAAVMMRQGRAFPGPFYSDPAYLLASRLTAAMIRRVLGWRAGSIPC